MSFILVERLIQHGVALPFRGARQQAGAWLLLLHLANRANDDGTASRPTVPTLGRDAVPSS